MASGLTSYEDNLFRLPATNQRNIAHPSDVANSVGIIGGVTTTSSPIIFFIQGALKRTLFLKNRALNSTEYDVSAQADYKARDGKAMLNLTHARRANTFEDLRVGPRSIQTLRIAHIEGDRLIVNGFGLVGESNFTINKNSNLAAQSGDNRRLEVIFGVGYTSPAGNIIALEGRRATTRGLEDSLAILGGQPIAYRAASNEQSVSLRVQWEQPRLWSIRARVGYSNYHDLSGFASNVQGTIGAGSASWSPTPFVTASVHAERSFSPDQTPFATGIKLTSYGVKLALKPMDAARVTVRYEKRNRVFRYDLQAADPLAAARIERLSTVGVTGDYELTSRLHATATFEHRWRDSNVPLGIYKGNAVSIGLSFPILR